MRHRFVILSLLAAWFLSTGSQWDLVQVFAWGRMFAGYVQVMSVGEALAQTFDAEKPCELCCAVRRAKQQEKKELPPELRLRDKLVLICQPATVFIAAAPDAKPWLAVDFSWVGRERARPALPPPRV